MFYRVVQCGATEYEGTTLGTTKQTFRYIFMHQIKKEKMIKALFYKGLGVKESKRVRGFDNSTLSVKRVFSLKDQFIKAGISYIRVDAEGRGTGINPKDTTGRKQVALREVWVKFVQK